MKYPRTAISAGASLLTLVAAVLVWWITGSLLLFFAIPVVAFGFPIIWDYSGGRQRQTRNQKDQ